MPSIKLNSMWLDIKWKRGEFFEVFISSYAHMYDHDDREHKIWPEKEFSSRRCQPNHLCNIWYFYEFFSKHREKNTFKIQIDGSRGAAHCSREWDRLKLVLEPTRAILSEIFWSSFFRDFLWEMKKMRKLKFLVLNETKKSEADGRCRHFSSRVRNLIWIRRKTAAPYKQRICSFRYFIRSH